MYGCLTMLESLEHVFFKDSLNTGVFTGLLNSIDIFLIQHNDARILKTATIPWECFAFRHSLNTVTLLVYLILSGLL